MKNMLYKEFKLCTHPTNLIFILLSALLIIPNYPFVRDYLDTKDPNFLTYKLIVLAIGFAIYVLFTYVAYLKSTSSF